MPLDSTQSAESAPEQSAKIFAFNSKGSQESSTTVPGMAPEVVAPTAESTEVPEPFDISGSISGAREGVKLSITPEVSVSDLVNEAVDLPAPKVEEEFPAFKNEAFAPIEPETPLSIAPEIVASAPEVATVDSSVLTAEETASLESAPAVEAEPEFVPEVVEPEAEVGPEPVLKAVEKEETIEEEPAGIDDVDATIAEANRLEQESLAKKREAIGQIDAEIRRIDQKSIDLLETHRAELHSYNNEKKNLESAHEAMVKLRKETAKQLGVDDNVESGPEAIAA